MEQAGLPKPWFQEEGMFTVSLLSHPQTSETKVKTRMKASEKTRKKQLGQS